MNGMLSFLPQFFHLLLFFNLLLLLFFNFSIITFRWEACFSSDLTIVIFWGNYPRQHSIILRQFCIIWALKDWNYYWTQNLISTSYLYMIFELYSNFSLSSILTSHTFELLSNILCLSKTFLNIFTLLKEIASKWYDNLSPCRDDNGYHLGRYYSVHLHTCVYEKSSYPCTYPRGQQTRCPSRYLMGTEALVLAPITPL